MDGKLLHDNIYSLKQNENYRKISMFAPTKR